MKIEKMKNDKTYVRLYFVLKIEKESLCLILIFFSLIFKERYGDRQHLQSHCSAQ